MAEKSLENLILAKGNNSCESESIVTKLEVELYYIMTNPYTKFEVNISKYDREKFGKTKFLQRALTPVKEGQAWRNSNLICIESKAIHIQNLKRLQRKVRKKNLSKG